MDTKTIKDTTISICKDMMLEIKEVRQTFSSHSYKEGFEETSSDTQTRFHWRLRGLASKLGADVIGTDDFDMNDQEIYYIRIASENFDLGIRGFKSREAAIRNALEFAKRNEIEVDGYSIVGRGNTKKGNSRR